MDASRRARLIELMATGDDPAGEVALYLEFGSDIGAVVRASVRAQGGGDRLDRDDLDDMTYEVCAELFRIRESWRPDGGALPWVWARRRIDAMVRDRAGPPRRGLCFADLDRPSDDHALAICGPEGGPDDGSVTSTLHRVAAVDRRVRLARELVGRLRPRSAELLLRYQIQLDAGDPSPSHTLAFEFGLRPPAVRQAVARARRQLSAVVEGNPDFACLRSSPLVGGRAGPPRTNRVSALSRGAEEAA